MSSKPFDMDDYLARCLIDGKRDSLSIDEIAYHYISISGCKPSGEDTKWLATQLLSSKKDRYRKLIDFKMDDLKIDNNNLRDIDFNLLNWMRESVNVKKSRFSPPSPILDTMAKFPQNPKDSPVSSPIKPPADFDLISGVHPGNGARLKHIATLPGDAGGNNSKVENSEPISADSKLQAFRQNVNERELLHQLWEKNSELKRKEAKMEELQKISDNLRNELNTCLTSVEGEHLVKQIEDLKKEIAKLFVEKEIAERRIAESNRESRMARKELDTLRKEISELRALVERQKIALEPIDERDSWITHLEAEITSWKKLAEENGVARGIAEGRLIEAGREMQLLESKLASNARLIEKLQATATEFSQYPNVKARVTELEVLNKQLRKEIEKVKSEKDGASNVAHSQSEIVAQFESQLASMRDASSKAAKTIEKMITENSSLKVRVGALQSIVDETTVKHQQEKETKSESVDHFKETIAELKGNLLAGESTWKKKEDGLKKEIEMLQTESKERASTIKSLREASLNKTPGGDKLLNTDLVNNKSVLGRIEPYWLQLCGANPSLSLLHIIIIDETGEEVALKISLSSPIQSSICTWLFSSTKEIRFYLDSVQSHDAACLKFDSAALFPSINSTIRLFLFGGQVVLNIGKGDTPLHNSVALPVGLWEAGVGKIATNITANAQLSCGWMKILYKGTSGGVLYIKNASGSITNRVLPCMSAVTIPIFGVEEISIDQQETKTPELNELIKKGGFGWATTAVWDAIYMSVLPSPQIVGIGNSQSLHVTVAVIGIVKDCVEYRDGQVKLSWGEFGTAGRVRSDVVLHRELENLPSDKDEGMGGITLRYHQSSAKEEVERAAELNIWTAHEISQIRSMLFKSSSSHSAVWSVLCPMMSSEASDLSPSFALLRIRASRLHPILSSIIPQINCEEKNWSLVQPSIKIGRSDDFSIDTLCPPIILGKLGADFGSKMLSYGEIKISKLTSSVLNRLPSNGDCILTHKNKDLCVTGSWQLFVLDEDSDMYISAKTADESDCKLRISLENGQQSTSSNKVDIQYEVKRW